MFRFGLLGAGSIGLKRSLNLPHGVEILSIYDPSSQSIEKFKNSNPARFQFLDNAKLVVENPDIDGIIVSTPHRYLAENAMAALRSGKHCLIEKPGGLGLAEISKINDEAIKSGVTVRFGFNHRFHPSIIKAKALLRDEKLGSVIGIRGVYGHGGRLGYENEWRHQRSISGGGELVDQGSHLIDLVQFLAGPMTLEFACLRNHFWNSDVEDNVYLALGISNRAVAWLHASWTEWKNLFRMEITLERGRLDISGLGGSYGLETLTLFTMSDEMGPPTRSEYTFREPDASWCEELIHFLRAVRGEPDDCATAQDTAAVWRIIEAAYS